MQRRNSAPVVALLLAVASTMFAATAGASIGTKFGKSPPDQRGFTTALGSTVNPRGISIKVITDPGLQFSITYSIECFRRSGGKTRFDDGGFNVEGPTTRRIAQTLKRPSKCVVSVAAAPFNNEGPVRLQLFARHPHR